eukprot:GFUD01134455.1.p1 GENE.GFUD01134455.1~~GFUD01134455.1.p1  ORF type:complete len:220 (+),score=90.62 GFUD01134455.1:83-742(+)
MMLYLSHLYLLTSLLPTTSTSMFPCLLVDTVHIAEVTQLEITIPKLECVSGCSLLSPSITTITCHSLREEQEAVSTTTILLSDTSYDCQPSTQLPPHLLLQLHSLDCEFCDTQGQRMVRSSCKLRYSLARMDSQGWYESGLFFVLMVTVIILLVLLYREKLEVNIVGKEDSLPVGIGEIVACEEYCGREEEMFRHGHSLLGGKRRGRSRSRRRKEGAGD